MSEHPIQGLMTTAMENIKDMIEVNTIIGDPVKSPDGTIIIPVSKVGFGFAAGGSEFNTSSQQGDDGQEVLPFGGGSGGGVSITPVAFLIVRENGMKIIHLDQSTHIYEKIIEQAPQTIEKIEKLLSKHQQKDEDKKRKKEQQEISFDI
mgnify:CR=1 FL=1